MRDWSPRVTDVLRRIDHMNIFLLIAGTYTPVSFALSSFWRDSIIIGMWTCTIVALVIRKIGRASCRERVCQYV